MALSYNVVKSALDAAKAATGGKFVAFDASFYLANYSVVRDANGAVIDNSLSSFAGDPLQHYVAQGAAAGYMPNGWFDPTFYRAQYNDVATLSAADLIVHYALYGVNEGRAPSSAFVNFNGTRYLADNPDVLPYVQANLASFGGSLSNGALAHYLKFGALEQRKAFDLTGAEIPFTMIPAQSAIAGTTVGDVTTVSLNTNDGDTLLTGASAVVDGGAGTASVLKLVGDADVRIDMTNPLNQVRGIDLNGDGVITANGVENNISAAGVATFKNFEIVDAYARNPLNEGDRSNNYLGDIKYDGTSNEGGDGDGVGSDGNIYLGGLGRDEVLGGVGNDFLVGGGIAGSIAIGLPSGSAEIADFLSGGRNADFMYGEFASLDTTDGVLNFYDGGTTADDSSAGQNSGTNAFSSQDSDWILVEISDDEEYGEITLNAGASQSSEDPSSGPQEGFSSDFDGYLDLFAADGFVALGDGKRLRGLLDDVENVDASGNLYGFLTGYNVELGGRRLDTRDAAGSENYGIGSSGQLRIFGSDEANKLIGGYDNDFISGGSGNDLLMGGNMQFFKETVAGGVTNPNLANIWNDGRDELVGSDGSDDVLFETDGGIYEGGSTYTSNDNTDDTLWVTNYVFGTRDASTMTADGVVRLDLEDGKTNNDADNSSSGAMNMKGYGGADALSGTGVTTADQTNYVSGVVRTQTQDFESVIATGLGSIDFKAAGSNSPDVAFDNQQNFRGYQGDLDLRGTSGANTLYANTGDDVLEGRGGKDKLSGGNGSDDFYFQLTGEDSSDSVDSVDVIHRQNDANNDNIWDGTLGRDFDIGGLQTLFDSTFTLGLPDTLAPYVDGVRFQLGGTVYQLSGLASPTVAQWTDLLEAKLAATVGLENLEVNTVAPNVITLTDPDGRPFVELTASGWLLTGGGLPSDGLDAWFQDVGAPQSDESLDRLIYKSYEDRTDNEGVDDDAITGSQITLGTDNYAEDLVADFAADGTRLAEDQSYTITFANLTTEDTVTITVNGVTYQLQVGVSVDGTQIDGEDGVQDTQAEIQTAFLSRLAGFINSFMDDDTAAGSVGASSTATTLTLTQNAYSDGEETVFMKSPAVVLTNQSGGEKPSFSVANNAEHEVHLLNYIASSLTGQLDRSERDDGSEAALNDENVLFIGQEFVNRATLQTALDTGEDVTGHDAVVINGGVDDLLNVAHNLATDDELNTDRDDDGFGDESNGNFAIHGDDYLIGGAGDDNILGGTGDDRVRGSLGDGVLVDDVVDGGKDLYAVRLVGQTKYQVEVLNAYEAEQRDGDPEVLDIYLIEQTEAADVMIGGDNFSPYFQDTLIFHQADFSAGNTEFTIDLNNFLVDGVTGEVILDEGGAGDVSIDVEGDGLFDSLTVFTNFEHIRTVSGVSRAVAGDGQGNDTLIVTDLSDLTDGVYYNLTNDGDVGIVQADTEVDDDDPEVRVWQDIIHVDGVENVIAGDGDDALDIDETEAAKNNLFSADLGDDVITYLNDFGDDDVEPTVTIKVESSTNTDLVEMTKGRVGTTVATDTLVSTETIVLAGNTAEGIREDDVLDATHIVRDVLVDFTEEEVRVDNNNDGDWDDVGELLVTIVGMYELENVNTDANDLVIVGDADYMSQNTRSDTFSTELIIDTYLNFDSLDDDLNRESISDMRANNELNNDIPEARNFEQFTYNLGQATDRVDYSQTNDHIAARVKVNADTNYVLVGEDLNDGENFADDVGDRVDALIGVEEIVASTAESILDFTALGQDVQVSFQFDEDNVDTSLDRMESLIRIGDGNGNTIDGIPNFVEYYDLDDDDDIDPFANAAWNRIEGSDFSEAVFYDGSEDLVNLSGVDHRFTDDVLNLRGGANNVSYFALETSVTAVVTVTEFDADFPMTTGLIDVDMTFQDGSGGALAGGGTHNITSYTGDNGIAPGSLKLEASQDAEDAVTFASLSEKVFLLGLSAGVLDVQIGDLDAMRLTGFEVLMDADSDDVYDMANLTTVLGGLTLVDNATDDMDTLVVRNDAVGFGAAPVDTIDLGVLNATFAFDFDVLDVTKVTSDDLILIGEVGNALNDDADDGLDLETLVVGDLSLIAGVQEFDSIVFTAASVANGQDTFTVDLDAGELLDGGNNVLFTFDGSLDTLDFSRIAATVDLDITVVDTAGLGITIIGGAGDDSILGGGGADTLIGGPGADSLDGGIVPAVGEVQVITLGAGVLDGADVITIDNGLGAASLVIGSSGSAGADITLANASSDEDQVGAGLAAYSVANWNAQLNIDGVGEPLISSVTYDAASNELRINYAATGNAAGPLTAVHSAPLAGDVAPVVSQDGAGTSVEFAAQGESADTFAIVEGDSTEAAMDEIANFSVGAVNDMIDFTGITILGGHSYEFFNIGSAFANYAAVKAAAVALIAGDDFPVIGSDGTDTWVFIDNDHDSNFETATDTVIKLVGIDATGIDLDNFVAW